MITTPRPKAGGGISRAPVKSLFELGAEPFRARARARRIIVDLRLPLARSDHVLGQIADFLVKRLEPRPDKGEAS